MGEKHKVLLIEDDSIVSKAYEEVLKDEGFNVHMATDGKEGMEAVKSFDPDLILLDLIMPVKDGMGFLEELRNDSEFKYKKVLILSNLDSVTAINKCKELGVVDYMVKSNNSLEEVISRIKEIFGEK